MQNEIKVVMVEPHKNPTITTIKPKLENLQKAVGGLIELIDITKEEYDTFIDTLKSAQENGQYIFSKPYYIYSGIKL